MKYIIDFQGFGGLKNNFFVKEIAVLKNNQHHHYVIVPPFPKNQLFAALRRQVHWLNQHYHGLTWEEGCTKFSELKKILQTNITEGIVYVKGAEKAKWIEKILNNENVEVVNVEDIYDCPSLNKLREEHPNEIKCSTHGKNCALENVYLLKKILVQ